MAMAGIRMARKLTTIAAAVIAAAERTLRLSAPKLWAAVSSWVPITDLTEWHRFCKAANYRYYKMMEACCGGPPGTPKTDEQYRSRSPIFRLSAAKGLPIDINAGVHDGHGGRSVPIDHSLKAFNVLAEATLATMGQKVDKQPKISLDFRAKLAPQR